MPSNERTVKVALLGEDRTLSKAFNDADNAADKFQKKMADTGEKLRSFGTKMTIGVTLPLALLSKSMFDAASDLNESTTKVQVVFADLSQSVIDFASSSAASLGISKQAALEATGTFGNLFRAMGIGIPKAADMSTHLVSLASDLASFNNADPSEVLEALRSGLVGEVEPLRKFGVNLTDVRLKAEAVRLGLIKADAVTHKLPTTLDAATKAQAAYSLIMQDTALAQGDFARTADGAANQSRILKAKFDDMQAIIGAKLLPYGLQLLDWASALVDKFSALSPETQDFALALGAIAAAIGPVSTVMGSLVGAVAFLVTPAGLVATSIAAIGGALLYVTGVWPEFNAKADEAIALFKEKWPAVRDKVVEVIEQIANWLATEGVTKLKEGVTWLRDAATSWVDGLWDGGEGQPGMLSKLRDTWQKLSDWVNAQAPVLAQNLDVWAAAAVAWIGKAAEQVPPAMDRFMVKLDQWVDEKGSEEIAAAGLQLAGALIVGFLRVVELIRASVTKIALAFMEMGLRLAVEMGYHGLSIGAKLISGLWDAIWNGIKDLGPRILNALKAMAGSIAGSVGDIFKNLLPDLGNVGGKIFGNANGGMIPSGWSMVGEKGPELVHKAGNSTRVFSNAQSKTIAQGWDGGGSSSPAPTYVYVGGEQVAAVVTNSQRYDARGRR